MYSHAVTVTSSKLKELAVTGASPAELNRQIIDRVPHDARFVLIGEATHGSEEFYRQRADLTKLLIEERGFNAVVAEADFPDAFRANLYARGLSKDRNAWEALREFQRFPKWMWANTAVQDFIEWLRQYNLRSAEAVGAAGFYGMDLYSLHRSANALLAFLKDRDPEAAAVVQERYRCFDRYGEDAKAYGQAVARRHRASCEAEALAALRDISARMDRYRAGAGPLAEEMALQAEANAFVVKGAEKYYRQMFFGEEVPWNIRDQHFLDALRLVERHMQTRGRTAKLVLWAHNSHLGDARATDASWRRNKLNVGQLMRQQYPNETYIIGFSTHTGTVAAADNWGQPMKVKSVRPSRDGSWEWLLHSTGIEHFALDLRDQRVKEQLQGIRLGRAIGVIYRPDTERQSHYFEAKIAEQFDLVIHKDTTSAVTPLPDLPPDLAQAGDLPETYPMAV